MPNETYTYGRNITLKLEKPFPFVSLESICIAWTTWKKCTRQAYFTDRGIITVWKINERGKPPKMKDLKEAYSFAKQCALILNLDFPEDLEREYQQACSKKPKGRTCITNKEKYQRAMYIALLLAVIEFEREYTTQSFGLDIELCKRPYNEYAKELFYKKVLHKPLQSSEDKGAKDPFESLVHHCVKERAYIVKKLTYHYKRKTDWEFIVKHKLGDILSRDYRELASLVYSFCRC